MSERNAVEAIIIVDNKVLLLKRSMTKKVAPGAWCVPSGGIDAGETPEEAIIREVKEETNLDVESFEIIKTYPRPAGGVFTGTFYQYRVTTTSTNVTISDEHTEFRWVNIGDIDKPDYDSLWDNLKDTIRG